MRRSSANGWQYIGEFDSLEIAKKHIKFEIESNPTFHHQIVDGKDNVVWKE